MKPLNISMLTICGLEELGEHASRPVTHVLSILDPDQPDPSVFGGYPRHSRTVLRFHDVVEPAPGQVLPQRAHVEEILAFGTALRDTPGPAHLLVHCHAGISRSTAAMTTLIAQLSPERSAEDILAQIVDMRPKAWPNSRMMESADDLLGRNGELLTAVGRLYALQLTRFPHIAEFMRNAGRGRELDMAGR